MSPALINGELQGDCIPPCLLPTHGAPPTKRPPGTYLLSQDVVLEKNPATVRQFLNDNEIALAVALQTAWALTLRCFVSCDVLLFDYVVRDNLAEPSIPSAATIIGRVDNSDILAVSLQRFQDKSLVRSAIPPIGFEIYAVTERPTSELCNTSLEYCLNRQSLNRAFCSPRTVLGISVIETANELLGQVTYQGANITDNVAASLLHTFKYILSQILTGPHNRQADLCSDLDRNTIRLLTQTISPLHDRCLHDLIVDQCRAHPDRIAVQSWDGNLTYGELDDLSLRLAHHLVHLGVGPEKYVLSCFDKSTWAIVARLAVLRAGGAYISIHATNPPIFLESVVQRTDAQVILSDVKFAASFQHLVPNFVGLSRTWLQSLPVNEGLPCDTVKPDNACLVLFTSGSTGTPKGIVQVHQSYATAIRDYARNFRLDSTTRFLHFDDYAFDISNLEFLVPLILGGCCCVPPPMKTTENLISAIGALQANIAFLTPTVAIKLDPKDIPSLRTICVGGEPLPKELIRKYESSSTRLVNQFGMGEVAICCAYNDNIQLERGNTIGGPATGAIWVVDPLSSDRLLPLGAVGELVIEGPHLSRRYLDNTAVSRTAAGFLQKTPPWKAQIHPDRTATRMYRSGDLGRLNHNGTIDYIGRKDTVLKLDGCRVDAIEVEHQARKCLSSRDAIIVDLLGTIDSNEDPRLTALLYLDDHPGTTVPVVNGDPTISNAEDDDIAREKVNTIRNTIQASLPRFMVPSVFLLMSWLPRTGSKKTDRKRIHMVGQKYYMEEREARSKSPYFAQQAQLLPL